MKKLVRKSLALVLSLAMCLSIATPAFSLGESNTKNVSFTLSLSESSLSQSSEDQTVTLTIGVSEEVNIVDMEYDFTCDTSFTVSEPTVPNGTSNWDADAYHMAWMASADVPTSSLGTIDVTIPGGTPAGYYEFKVSNITLSNDTESDYWEETAYATATLTISNAASTDLYTANISTTATEFKVNDPVAVTVNVGGTVGSFASSEVTLTYDSTYLTFNQDASTMNGAGVDLTTAGTIKLVDHGETNAYPAAYVLNFTAAKATDDATTAVTLTDARFSTAENAISSDLIEATGENALSLTIKNADLKVTLPESDVVTGNNTVPYGDDYTFTAKNNTTYMYYDYEVSATMGGSDVSSENIVNNGNGTWTVKNVTGDLVISVTETPKTYTVTVKGDSTVTSEEIAKVTTTGVTDGKAAYNTAVTYTLPAGQAATETVDGWHYTATVTIGGTAYTASANDLTYTIDGSKVTGNIEITLSKVTDAANSVTVTIKDSNEIQKDGTTVTEFTATKNSNVTLTLVPETGYTYEINDGTNDLTINDDNTFTVSVGETAITITVTKTLDTSSVKVQKYLQLNNTVMWLVTINGNGTTEISGKTYTYINNNMFWSSKYQAYCCLDVAATLSVEAATARVGTALVEADAIDVEYNMDVNNTEGKVDANDAQLVYNMYQTKAYGDFSAVDMIKFLEADLNSTVGVDSTDAQVIVNKLLNITAAN